MDSYYSEKLAANKLKHCYQLAPPRVGQYLDAEINCVLQKIRPGDLVLELGCGYGRVLARLAEKARRAIGIDISFSSLALAQETLTNINACHLLQMDALRLGFASQTFDCVVVIQNGISSFHVSEQELILESIRVTKPGGTVLYSTYSDKFWEHRLEWFRLQSEAGLVGEIDYDKTGNGVIVCKDGFTATTVSPEQFSQLTKGLNAATRIFEVDNSSLFCEIIPY